MASPEVPWERQPDAVPAPPCRIQHIVTSIS